MAAADWLDDALRRQRLDQLVQATAAGRGGRVRSRRRRGQPGFSVFRINALRIAPIIGMQEQTYLALIENRDPIMGHPMEPRR